MYEGALFSFKGDFLDYLGLENMGVFTAHGSENKSEKNERRTKGVRGIAALGKFHLGEMSIDHKICFFFTLLLFVTMRRGDL